MKKHMTNLLEEYPDQYHMVLVSGMLKHLDELRRTAPSPSELAATSYQAGIECGREEGAAQAREEVLDALVRDWKGRYVEDAVAEIRRFPESLRTEGGERR